MGSRVAAHVEQHLRFHRHDRAVRFCADFYFVRLLARLVHRFEILAAVFDPADGFAKMPGCERDQEIFGVKLSPGAEAAADFRLDEVDAALRQADQVREDAPIGVGHLGRPPHGQQAAAFVPFGDQAAIFQRHRRMTLGGKLLFEN